MQELFARFPEMQPISKAPALTTVNGIGMMLYGNRDFDAETHTYVKTLWFTLAFIPIFPAGAYRVADAPNGGWFFLGRVPLSGIARGWPFVLIALAGIGLGGALWYRHVNSPEYLAKKQLDEADRLRRDGQLAEAARLYKVVARKDLEPSRKAVDAVTDMLNDQELQQKAAAKEMAGVFKVAWELRNEKGGVKDLFQRGLKFVEARGDGSAEGCLAVLDAIEPAVPRPDALLAPREKLLDRLIAQRPDDVALLSQLAVVYEATKRRDRCEAFLKPHEKKLGTTEGARILGQIYFDKGKQVESLALLEPYLDSRLPRFHQVEERYTLASRQAYKKIEDRIANRDAPDFPYERFQRAGPELKATIWNEYFATQLNRDDDLKSAVAALQPEMPVMDVAMDLASVLVQRARQRDDPAARKKELERAERTLQAVQGVAEGQSSYRLKMGEVKFWLGKQQEGKQLYDEELASQKRSFDALFAVARSYRELGAETETRALLEEAYNQ